MRAWAIPALLLLACACDANAGDDHCNGTLIPPGDHVSVPATIAGKRVSLLLDPIDDLLLDRGHARDLGLRAVDGRAAGLGGEARIGGAGDASHAATFVLDLPLEVAGRSLRVGRAIVTALHEGTAGSLGREHAGLLGTGLLRGSDIDFDPGTRCLRLLAAEHAPPAQAIALPVSWMRGRPTIGLSLQLASGERIDARFNVDFGMAGSIRLSTRFVDGNDLVRRMQAREPDVVEYGLGGALESMQAEVVDVLAAAVSRGPASVTLAREASGADAAPPWDGLVGLAWLNRHHWRYSQQRSVLWLTPLASTRSGEASP